MKPKTGAPPTDEEKAHHDRLRALGCILASLPLMKHYRCAGRTTIHHVSSDGYQRIARSERRVVALCEKHHLIQHGPRESVEALSHAGFMAVYGVNLLVEADRLWQESVERWKAR